VPPVDIYEDSHRLLLKLEVPGIRQEDLDIRVEHQTLTVKGERKFAQDEREETSIGSSVASGASSEASPCP
jgi:HSP20 family protein